MKRIKFDRKGYTRVVKSTRTHYDEYSQKYVEFYENWLKRQSKFSDPSIDKATKPWQKCC